MRSGGDGGAGQMERKAKEEVSGLHKGRLGEKKKKDMVYY